MNSDKSRARELCPKQQKYVLDNYQHMQISEMARNLNVGRMSVFNFMDERDLPIKNIYKPRAVEKEKESDQFFRHDKNWI